MSFNSRKQLYLLVFHCSVLTAFAKMSSVVEESCSKRLRKKPSYIRFDKIQGSFVRKASVLETWVSTKVSVFLHFCFFKNFKNFRKDFRRNISVFTNKLVGKSSKSYRYPGLSYNRLLINRPRLTALFDVRTNPPLTDLPFVRR